MRAQLCAAACIIGDRFRKNVLCSGQSRISIRNFLSKILLRQSPRVHCCILFQDSIRQGL